MSKILEGEEERRQEFFQRLKENLAADDQAHQDRVVDEFPFTHSWPLKNAHNEECSKPIGNGCGTAKFPSTFLMASQAAHGSGLPRDSRRGILPQPFDSKSNPKSNPKS
jgi:hypothetical protein